MGLTENKSFKETLHDQSLLTKSLSGNWRTAKAGLVGTS